MSAALRLSLVLGAVLLAGVPPAAAQDAASALPFQLVRPDGPSAPPLVVTLRDALTRARENDAQYRATAADAESAREDRVQAKSSLLPALSHTTQYLGTQSNDVLPGGRFVTNDGVHVFRSWAVVHQEISAKTLLMTPYPAGGSRRSAGQRPSRGRAARLAVTDPHLLRWRSPNGV